MTHDEMSFFLKGANGKGILLIHGLTGAPAEMRLVARHLHRRGYSVYAPLLAGHGADVDTFRRSRWEDWLESVQEGAELLQARADAVFAAGICVGGKLAMMAADRTPDKLQAVAIYSPCFGYDGWNVPISYQLLSPHVGWLSHVPFLDRLNFRETPSLGIKDDRLRQKIGAMVSEGVLESFPGRGIVEMRRLGNALKDRLPHLQTPTLILHAVEDDLSNPRNARHIAAHIGGPHELRWIKDSYHMIHVDRHHKEVAEYTAEFFEAPHAPARS